MEPRPFIVDAHCDTLLQIASGQRRLGIRSQEGHVDLPRLRDGGVTIQFFACFVEPEYKPDRALQRLLDLIDAFYREISSTPDIRLILNASDIDSVFASAGLGALLSVEGGEPIGKSLPVLRVLYRLGVRCLGLVWNHRNLIGDGAGEQRARGGLTDFGVQVVEEMNRLGMIVDVSHLNERGFWDVIAVSTQPVIASHSNARKLCDHPRNLRDRQIRALAEHGGVICVNYYPPFLSPDGKATIDTVIDHIDHIVQVGGISSVGLGSDFDGIDTVAVGLEDASRLPRLVEGLLRRGYKETDVRLIIGGNLERVIRTILGKSTS